MKGVCGCGIRSSSRISQVFRFKILPGTEVLAWAQAISSSVGKSLIRCCRMLSEGVCKQNKAMRRKSTDSNKSSFAEGAGNSTDAPLLPSTANIAVDGAGF